MGSDNMCKNPFVEKWVRTKNMKVYICWKWVRTTCMKNTFLEKWLRTEYMKIYICWKMGSDKCMKNTFVEKWFRTKCLEINDFVQIRPGGLWTKLAIFNDFVQRNRVFWSEDRKSGPGPKNAKTPVLHIPKHWPAAGQWTRRVESLAFSIYSRARSLEPWAMSHEPVIINHQSIT